MRKISSKFLKSKKLEKAGERHDMADILVEMLGLEDAWDNLVSAMSDREFKDKYDYIARIFGFPDEYRYKFERRVKNKITKKNEVYQGFSNEPTSIIALGVSNDRDLYDNMMNMAQAAKNTKDLANKMKNYFMNSASNITGSVNWASELLKLSLSEVNWIKIAEDFMEYLD